MLPLAPLLSNDNKIVRYLSGFVEHLNFACYCSHFSCFDIEA